MWSELRLRKERDGIGRGLFVLALALVAVALMARSALGQERMSAGPFDLTGVVVDDRGEPLVGAFVALEGSDWGSLTDARGRFVLPDMAAGRIALTAEQLGYATLHWEGEVTGDSGPLMLRLEAQPVLLEGLHVVTDRFQSRRNAVATSVNLFDRSDLVSSTQPTVVDFVRARAGIVGTPCRGFSHSSLCFWSRGQVVEPRVYIDEMPVIGGLDYLESFRPHELYMVEVYARGRHIRAYTTQFMERAAKTRLMPLALLH